MTTRSDLLDSFVAALEPLGILDRYQLAGVVANWWGDVQFDVKALAHHDFAGVVQGWRTTIEAAFDTDEDDARDKQRIAAEKRRAREHSAVPLLIPDYLAALDEAEARRADLDAQVKAATAKPDEDDEPDEDLFAAGLAAADLKKLKADLTEARRTLRKLEAEFLTRLKQAVAKLDEAEQQSLVLQVLNTDLITRLLATFDTGPRALSDRYRLWADKYAVPLMELRQEQSVAEARFSAYLKELGYE